MSQKLTFTGTTSQEIFLTRGRESVGSLQFISGTGSIVVESSMDDGVTYVAIGLSKSIDNAVVASVTAAGLFYFKIAAYDRLRVRCSAFTDAIIVYVNTIPING